MEQYIHPFGQIGKRNTTGEESAVERTTATARPLFAGQETLTRFATGHRMLWENAVEIVFIAVVVAAVIFILIMKSLGRGTSEKQATGSDFPYQAGLLLSAAEYSFWRSLQLACPDGIHVSPKVRIADFVDVRKGLTASAWRSAFNRIASKHCDFVLVDQSGRVLAALELDDASHQKAAGRDRDAFVVGVYQAAGIALLRFEAKRDYSIESLRASVTELLQRTDVARAV